MPHSQKIFAIAAVLAMIVIAMVGSAIEERYGGSSAWKAGSIGAAIMRGFFLGAALGAMYLVLISIMVKD